MDALSFLPSISEICVEFSPHLGEQCCDIRVFAKMAIKGEKESLCKFLLMEWFVAMRGSSRNKLLIRWERSTKKYMKNDHYISMNVHIYNKTFYWFYFTNDELDRPSSFNPDDAKGKMKFLCYHFC